MVEMTNSTDSSCILKVKKVVLQNYKQKFYTTLWYFSELVTNTPVTDLD